MLHQAGGHAIISTVMRIFAAFLVSAFLLSAQPDFNSLKELKYRNIGPFRGGRAVAVSGVTSQPSVYYFGGTGGGIWKTTDGGVNWAPVADGQLKTGSVGSIAVAESDPNIVYVGMGEPDIRGNASQWRWRVQIDRRGQDLEARGACRTRYHIGAVRIHPKNPDIVYVAALGHQLARMKSAAVYRTTDGGKTWKQMLYARPQGGRDRPDHRSQQSERDLRCLLGSAPHALGSGKRRAGQRAVQVH